MAPQSREPEFPQRDPVASQARVPPQGLQPAPRTQARKAASPLEPVPRALAAGRPPWPATARLPGWEQSVSREAATRWPWRMAQARAAQAQHRPWANPAGRVSLQAEWRTPLSRERVARADAASRRPRSMSLPRAKAWNRGLRSGAHRGERPKRGKARLLAPGRRHRLHEGSRAARCDSGPGSTPRPGPRQRRRPLRPLREAGTTFERAGIPRAKTRVQQATRLPPRWRPG